MSILVTCRGEQEKYFFRLKAAVNYGIVKCQAGTEVIRIEVSSLEGFFFRSQQLTYKIVYTCIALINMINEFLSFSVLRHATTGRFSGEQ